MFLEKSCRNLEQYDSILWFNGGVVIEKVFVEFWAPLNCENHTGIIRLKTIW